jgi:hypothetical protein
MPQCLEPKLSALPAAQREIWESLAPASHLKFVLYGGTAVALHLGHRVSVDFDFFCSEPLNKDQIRKTFAFVKGAAVLQDMPDTLVVLARMPSGPVKVRFSAASISVASMIRCRRATAPCWLPRSMI